MATSLVLVHASNDMFAATKRRQGTIRVLDNGDIYTTGEGQKDHAYLRGRPGFDEYIQGELAIGWRRSKFEKIGSWHEQVTRGGKIGSGRPGDHRRRGPSRLVAMVALRVKATGEVIIVATHHAIAKADTAHKWRRPLRDEGFADVADAVNWFAKKHPGAGVILTGDLNTRGRITIFKRAGLVEVPTKATFGRLRYDRIYRKGLSVKVLRYKNTPTDHAAIVSRVTLPEKAA